LALDFSEKKSGKRSLHAWKKMSWQRPFSYLLHFTTIMLHYTPGCVSAEIMARLRHRGHKTSPCFRDKYACSDKSG